MPNRTHTVCTCNNHGTFGCDQQEGVVKGYGCCCHGNYRAHMRIPDFYRGSVSVKLTVQVAIGGPKDVIGGVQGVLASLLA